MRADRVAVTGSVVSGLFASACCIGPLVFALLGVSGAAFARSFEPFRPYLLAVTYCLLGGAFYFTYRGREAECGPGSACAMPATKRVGRAMLWVAAIIVVLATTFPWYAEYLPL